MVNVPTPYFPLISYKTVDDYRRHFEQKYCCHPIVTFDGISVRFSKNNFDHAFFESIKGGKDNQFSRKRADRIDWIKVALQDSTSERYLGWDKNSKTYTRARRVTIIMGDYVVVIALSGIKTADFITAFVADTPGRPGRPSTLQQIRKGPKWK